MTVPVILMGQNVYHQEEFFGRDQIRRQTCSEDISKAYCVMKPPRREHKTESISDRSKAAEDEMLRSCPMDCKADAINGR